jgi:hypothetical protein
LKLMMDRVDVMDYVRPFYPNFSVFYILVFCLGL